jgi:hypothetical protein
MEKCRFIKIRIMKQLVLALVVCFVSRNAKAQLAANAGRDTVWCSGALNMASPMFGGAATASNGTPPYTYQWSSVELGMNTAYYFDSISIAHPRLVTILPSNIDSLHLVVKVTDANAAVAYDTAVIFCSRWICSMADCYTDKGPADTFSLFAACRSNFGPFTYQWSPATYLSDPSVDAPKCWSPVQQTYTLVQTDRKGCMVPGECKVYIKPTSVNRMELADNDVRIVPNPVTGASVLKTGDAWCGGNICFYSADGRLLASRIVIGAEMKLGDIGLTAGMYSYRIVSSAGDVRSGKIFY